MERGRTGEKKKQKKPTLEIYLYKSGVLRVNDNLKLSSVFLSISHLIQSVEPIKLLYDITPSSDN